MLLQNCPYQKKSVPTECQEGTKDTLHWLRNSPIKMSLKEINKDKKSKIEIWKRVL